MILVIEQGFPTIFFHKLFHNPFKLLQTNAIEPLIEKKQIKENIEETKNPSEARVFLYLKR
jgi:hypothetical protein